MPDSIYTSNEVRKIFLEFFERKKHEIVASAPLVLKNDPTLLFTNAGMNQFKDYFLNYRTPEFKRVADSQKCLRVSGKHNDLEDVGYDTYHQTMFEMLGNWSFGDYFKKEAIAWAWELLTEIYKIDKDRIYVTVFEGDPADSLSSDEEAYNFWSEWIDKDRILFGSKKDNFWEMGDTGPCGPCSEIHIDIRNEKERNKMDGKELVNKDHPQVVELWNLVFMDFNRKADGSLEKLPQQHIDTGMGFERLCMVLQNKDSNYQTDLFQPIIHKVEQLSSKTYSDSDTMSDVAFRVISDHIRAISFAIADGQLPSNTGAGYVIRRILRRAVRYGYSFLDFNEPFLNKLVPVLAEKMGEAYPELVYQKELIEKVVEEEELSFLRTMASGIKRLDQMQGNISGSEAFELYDTYGFPLDLTKLIAKEKGIDVDEKGFDQEMQKQKDRSRKDAKVETGDWIILKEGTSKFVGYEQTEANIEIIRYRTLMQKGKEIVQIVFDQTPFYPEGGGQIGDQGEVIFAGQVIPIFDTKKENDLIIHFSSELPQSTDLTGLAKVNVKRRRDIENNHSATHLLHAALRQVLGKHVEQKGSLVTDKKLRFDFSHFSKVTDEELKQVENIVNRKIGEDIDQLEQREIAFSEAINQGAMALFGEKYGDKVRMITFDPEYSVELCGGTHVDHTAAIRLFKITSESAISAGVRRIEAITGDEALHYFQEQEHIVSELSGLLNNSQDARKSVENLVKENKELQQELQQYTTKQSQEIKQELKSSVTPIHDLQFIGKVVSLSNPGDLKNILFELRNEIENLVAIVGMENDGKAFLQIMISNHLVAEKNLNASVMIRELAKEIEGGGGGQDFYATAGGKNPNGLNTAIEMGRSLIENG